VATSILIGALTLSLVLILRRELAMAVREPTPARSLAFVSVAYVVGATLVQWREGTEDATVLYFAYTLHFVMYLVGFFSLSEALRLKLDPMHSRGPLHASATWLPTAAKWGFFVLAFGATAYLVLAVGAYRILTALFQFVLYGDVDVSVLELRLGLASGEERWIAPGYLKQLRDVLLPLATFFVLFSVRRSVGVFLLLALMLVPLVTTLIISTGERAPVVLFLVALIYVAIRSVTWGIQPLRVVAVPLLVVGFVGLATLFALTLSFTSRYEDGANVNVLLVLADRVVTRAPEENMLSAPLWMHGAPFPGAGWLSELSTVLPGTQKTLSNLLHEHLGGGDLGNSVLGAWVDVHYNFGWALGIGVSVLIGFVMALFNHWVNVSRGVSRTADICGIWISICMLFVLSPYGFVLYGPFLLSAVLLALLVLGRMDWLIGPVTPRISMVIPQELRKQSQ
jgi:hypothetical protein